MERKKFHIGNLTARHRKKLHIWLRAGIQLICFLLFSSAFTAAFGGVKYIAVQLGAGEKVEWTGFTAALAGLCGFTIVFGRFFCGFACAFGSLGDFVHGVYCRICRKCRPVVSEILCSGSDCCTVFSGGLPKASGQQPLGCVFHDPGREFPARRVSSRTCHIVVDFGGYVCAGTVFLPLLMSHGGSVFHAAGAAGIFPE